MASTSFRKGLSKTGVRDNCLLQEGVHLEGEEIVGLSVPGDARLDALDLLRDKLREGVILDAFFEAGVEFSVPSVDE